MQQYMLLLLPPVLGVPCDAWGAEEIECCKNSFRKEKWPNTVGVLF